MKKELGRVLGFLVISGGLIFASETRGPAVAFTLAATGGDSGVISFTLAPGLARALFEETTSNTVVGLSAFASNISGLGNSAFGSSALYSNTTGHSNVAVGSGALYSNTTGNDNVAVGNGALGGNVSWVANIAIGGTALPRLGDEPSRESSGNVAIGFFSNELMEWGNGNTVIGTSAMRDGGGNYNTIMGMGSGSYSFGHFNILIGPGVSADIDDVRNESNTIRIGSPYNPSAVPDGPPFHELGTASIPTGLFAGQNRTFIAGIVEHPFTPAETEIPAVVGILSTGQLGTVPAELLPEGPQGPPGIQGQQGPAGEGLVSGSLLFLRSGYTPPNGYALLGTTSFSLTPSGSKKPTVITVNVYQRQ